MSRGKVHKHSTPQITQIRSFILFKVSKSITRALTNSKIFGFNLHRFELIHNIWSFTNAKS